MKFSLLAAVVAVALAGTASAQCPNGVCPIKRTASFVRAATNAPAAASPVPMAGPGVTTKVAKAGAVRGHRHPLKALRNRGHKRVGY